MLLLNAYKQQLTQSQDEVFFFLADPRYLFFSLDRLKAFVRESINPTLATAHCIHCFTIVKTTCLCVFLGNFRDAVIVMVLYCRFPRKR
jgi:hypothetical protein